MRSAKAFCLRPIRSRPSTIWERCCDKSVERRGEGAQKLGVRVGAGLRFEVGDRGLHVSDGNAPLRHLRLQIRDVAFVAPALRVQIELRAGPDGGERKSRRLDLLAGPVRIGLSLRLSDRLRRRAGPQSQSRERRAPQDAFAFPLERNDKIGLAANQAAESSRIASLLTPFCLGDRPC